MSRILDVHYVRTMFPALRRTYRGMDVAYLDGPGGSQTVQTAIDEMSQYMMRGGANLHGVFPTSMETEMMIDETRQAVANFLRAEPAEIAFGPNMTTLTLAISRALVKTFQPGDEIIVTELDHRANVDPWLHAARDHGVVVKWLKVNPETLTLQYEDLGDLLTEKTKLVAVGLASNAIGTVNDVAEISRQAHKVGAMVVVDAVHGAPHVAIDRDQLGADILLCSAYKFFGPHVGIAAIREDLFDRMPVYKLKPAPDGIPDKLETGTQNHEGIAGVRGALKFIEGIGLGQTARERLIDGIESIQRHEDRLAKTLRHALRQLSGVTVYSASDEILQTPTVSFRVDGYTPREVCRAVLENTGSFVADGDFYALTLAQRLGVDRDGGFVRAGLAPYNTMPEVERLIRGIEQLIGR